MYICIWVGVYGMGIHADTKVITSTCRWKLNNGSLRPLYLFGFFFYAHVGRRVKIFVQYYEGQVFQHIFFSVCISTTSSIFKRKKKGFLIIAM